MVSRDYINYIESEEEYFRRSKEEHRLLRSKKVRIPSFLGNNNMKRYKDNYSDWEWEGEWQQTGPSQFCYKARFPEGRVFSDRKAHYKIYAEYDKGGLFRSKEIRASLEVLAFPSDDYHIDGYGYLLYVRIDGKTLSSVLSFFDAMVKDLQSFVDNYKLGDEYVGNCNEYYFYDKLNTSQVENFFVWPK